MDKVNINLNSNKLQIDEEKQRLLAYFEDMFTFIPQEIILKIAEENHWDGK